MRIAREKAGLTQAKLAVKSGISLRSIGRFENNQGNITSKNLEQLALTLNTPVSFFTEPLSEHIGEDFEIEDHIDEHSDPDAVPVYRYNAQAGAGSGIQNFDTERAVIYFDRAYLRRTYKIHSTKGLHIIEAKGNSMLPTIAPGDQLMVLEFGIEPFIDGEIYVVLYNDELRVKRVQRHPSSGKVRLISDNPSFEPADIEGEDLENFKIIGRVLSQTRWF